jgi:hypothetical protein
MFDVFVIDEKDMPVGTYQSVISPRVGERLDANNGHWIVVCVQHDIRGMLDADSREKPIESGVVVYATRCSRYG